MNRPLVPSLLTVLALVLLAAVAVHVSTAIWPREVTDVLTYRHAAEVLRVGGTGLYEIERLPPGVWPYLYPPAFAALVAPVFLLPAAIAHGLWAAVVSASVVVSFWALRRLGRLGVARTVALAVCLALPTAWLMVMGQVDALVVALLALALLADQRDRAVVAGLLIGLAAAIKVIPVLALLPLLVLRRWRVVTGAVAAGAALSLLPLVWLVPAAGFTGGASVLLDLHVAFVQDVVLLGLGQPAAREWMLLPWNGSLPGAALRLVGAPAWGTLVMWLLILAGTLIAHRARDAKVGVALVVTAGALGSFVFSTHNIFLFALPLGLAFSFTTAGLLVAAFVLVNWVSPVLGTVGYLAVWSACAMEPIVARRSAADRPPGATPPRDERGPSA